MGLDRLCDLGLLNRDCLRGLVQARIRHRKIAESASLLVAGMTRTRSKMYDSSFFGDTSCYSRFLFQTINIKPSTGNRTPKLQASNHLVRVRPSMGISVFHQTSHCESSH